MEPVDGLNASIEEQTKFWSAPPPYQAEIDHEGSDIRAIKLVVSITLGITLVLAAGYLGAVLLSDGAILLRPSEVALERHATYHELVQPAPETLTGNGVVACIVDSGIALDHTDFESVNLVGWKDFINGNSDPYDDHGPRDIHGRVAGGQRLAQRHGERSGSLGGEGTGFGWKRQRHPRR